MQHVDPTLLLKGEEDDPVSIVTKSLEDLQKALDERLKKIEAKETPDVKALEAKIAELEKKANRPGQAETKDEPSAERKAFQSYLRFGERSPAEELKTLQVSSDPGGGYFAPAEFSSEFIRDLTEVSPLRRLSTVVSISSGSIVYPKRTGNTNALWRGETQTRTESEPTFGQIELFAKELATWVPLSNILLADSGGVAESEARAALVEDFQEKEGQAFISGTGVLAPEGILTNADIEDVPSHIADNFDADAVIALYYSVSQSDRMNAAFICSTDAIRKIRTLKDGNGSYIWSPALTAGDPALLMGRPCFEDPYMPTVGAGLKPIAFGNFARGYRIVERAAMSILVDPYTAAVNGLTKLHATRRVGAGVVAPSAIRRLKIAVS